MHIKIFAGQDNLFYLAKSSNLNHRHHPRLKSEAILCGQHDMQKGDLDLLTLLFSVNVTPIQISHFMEELRGPDAGTFTPKRIYDMNKKTEDLYDYLTGSLTESNGAEKNNFKIGTKQYQPFLHLT